MHLEQIDRIFTPLVESGLVATCGVVDLEVLYSTRSGAEHAAHPTAASWLGVAADAR